MRKLAPWFIAGAVTFGLSACTLISRSPSVATSSPQPLVSAPSPEIDLRWVYINQDLKWESPPKEITPITGAYRYADNGRLLVFFPNGKFASISCLIHRYSTKMQLIPNEGYSVYKGEWVRNADATVTVTSSLFSSNKISVFGIAEGHSPRAEQLIIRKFATERLAEQFDLNGQSFMASPNIEGIIELLATPEGDI